MKTTLTLSLLTLSSLSFGFGFGDIAHWTGTGTSSAALVVDFANGGPSYVWGYHFSGASTGLAMINAIAADSTSQLSVNITHYSFGDAVTGIAYGSNNAQGFDPNSPGFWGYYTSEVTPLPWTESMVGAGDRSLSNGSWDGWAWAPNLVGNSPNTTMVAAVPEPTSWAILGLGLLGLARRRTNKS